MTSRKHQVAAETRPYTVTEDNLKRGVFKDCQDGNHGRCKREITHRFAQPESGIWNYQCSCECHPTAFGDDSQGLSPETRALAEDTFSRIEKSNEAQDRFARR